MIIYVHNEELNKIEKYERSLSQDMPYTTNKHLTVSAFLGDNNTNVLWSSKAFLEAFESSIDHEMYPFHVNEGFFRGWQVVKNGMYVHKLGSACNGAENLSYCDKVNLTKALEFSNQFTKIGHMDIDSTVVHMHQCGEHVNEVIPFPSLRFGDIGVAVFVLQDTLWALSYPVEELNGEFDMKLEYLVKEYQRTNGLAVDGIVGSNTWLSIMKEVHPDDVRLNVVNK